MASCQTVAVHGALCLSPHGRCWSFSQDMAKEGRCRMGVALGIRVLLGVGECGRILCS